MTTDVDWLEWRKGGIGASDIAALLGISPWSSPWSVWADKLGLLPPLPDTGKMEFGRRAEKIIAPWFTDLTGLHIAGEQMWCTNPERPWMRATPDGMVVAHPDTSYEEALGGFEMKFDSRSARWSEVPAHYQAQAQWQMAVTGWQRVWFAVLHGWRLEVYELERDQADIDLMIERAEQFWHDHVLAEVEPPTDGHDATAAAIAHVYSTVDDDKTVALDDQPDAVAALRSLAAAKAMKASAETEVKALTARVKTAMGDAYEATIAGERAATCGTQTKKTTCEHCGAVDESKPFRVLRPTKEIPA